MEKLFELSCQDQTLNPQVGTFTDASQTTGTFTLEDGEYYLTNGDTKGFYAYSPVAMQSGLVDDGKVIIEFDLKVVTASVNTRTIIGTYAGVDSSGIPTGAKITLQYNNGDIELVLGSGTTATLVESADVVVGQWYHFRIDCALTAAIESTYKVKIDGVLITTVTGATTDYALGIISVLGTDLHACDECGIKNITLVTETNMFVGRTALDQALTDTKGYVDNQVGACVPLAGSNQISGSLIPATDNSIDIGSSTKNLKMLYTKGITIDGTQFLPSNYIPRSGGAVMTGTRISRVNNTSELCIDGGRQYQDGGALSLFGKNSSSAYRGGFWLTAHNTSECILSGTPDGTLIWGGQPIQTSSDARLKQQITEIDDKLLDAWEDVNLVQFKYNDAVKEKSDNARLHTGYVVQQIDDACKSHNVDISKYGLYCHEEYAEETREAEQADGTKKTEVVRPANEHYSLRYTEALIVECAYLRKCIKELRNEIEELKSSK